MSAGLAIPPGKTIGVLGGGQLGRMLAEAAKRMGYRFHVYEPSAKCPAGALADKEVNAPYEDLAALRAFAKECAVVTYEFENVPAAPLKAIEAVTRLRPHWRVWFRSFFFSTWFCPGISRPKCYTWSWSCLRPSCAESESGWWRSAASALRVSPGFWGRTRFFRSPKRGTVSSP